VTEGLATILLFARPREAGAMREPGSDLVDRCRRGDRLAMNHVLMEHAEYLERVLARLVGPRFPLEDLLQDTFAAAIIAFPRFRGEASVRTWLHRIAINTAHAELRRPRHRRDEPLVGEPVATAASAPQQLEDAQLSARLYAHLEKLDARKRIAFILHVLDDRPIAEVAALMGASASATKSRIFWARRTMHGLLSRDPAFHRGGAR